MHMGISHEHLCTWVFHMSTYAHGYFTRAPMHMGTSHEHLCTWVLHTSTYAHGYFTRAPMYIYDNILLISSKNEKCFRQKLQRKSKHTFYVQNLFPKIGPNNEITWKNTVQLDSPQMTIWRMRFACRITKATNTYSQYVILIAFPRQHWLRELYLLLRLTYYCLSCLRYVMCYVAYQKGLRKELLKCD